MLRVFVAAGLFLAVAGVAEADPVWRTYRPAVRAAQPPAPPPPVAVVVAPVPDPAQIAAPAPVPPPVVDQPKATDARGTEQDPLLVKVLTPAKTDAETAEEAKARDERNALDRGLVKVTGDIAWWTAVLVGVLVLQFLAFLFHVYWFRRSVKSAR